MLESIGISLVATLISFLFEQNILRKSHIDIEGAPFWYEQRSDQNKIYVSTYVDGDLSSIEKAKGEVVKKITIIIEDAYKVTIRKEFMKLRSKKEIKFIKGMQNDSYLSTFVKNNTVIQDIKYDKDVNRAFVRGYMPLEVLKQYQTQRIIKIKKRVLDYQFDDMMEELEKEAS